MVSQCSIPKGHGTFSTIFLVKEKQLTPSQTSSAEETGSLLSQCVIYDCGGTICANLIGSALGHFQKHSTTDIFRGDSSQLTKSDLDNLSRDIQDKVKKGHKKILLIFGTDTCCDVVNRLKHERLGANIVIATSMVPLDLDCRNAFYDKCLKEMPKDKIGSIQLVVNIGNGQHIEKNISKDSPDIYKDGSIRKGVFLEWTGEPAHIKHLRALKLPMIFSNPEKNPVDVANEIKEHATFKNSIILVGCGDFNFFTHPIVVEAINLAKASGCEILLTTITPESFKFPGKVPYEHRQMLEEMDIELLWQNNFLKISAKSNL